MHVSSNRLGEKAFFEENEKNIVKHLVKIWKIQEI